MQAAQVQPGAYETVVGRDLFNESEDRRRGARVPFEKPVKLGPPGEPARTTLIAEDLSAGGIFVRCPQPVLIGAKFSLEIPLEGRDPLYIARAEVLYNRRPGDDAASGFGARFLDLESHELARVIEASSLGSSVGPVSSSMIVYAESELSPAKAESVAPAATPVATPVVGPALAPTEPLSSAPRQRMHVQAIDLLEVPTEAIDAGAEPSAGALPSSPPAPGPFLSGMESFLKRGEEPPMDHRAFETMRVRRSSEEGWKMAGWIGGLSACGLGLVVGAFLVMRSEPEVASVEAPARPTQPGADLQAALQGKGQVGVAAKAAPAGALVIDPPPPAPVEAKPLATPSAATRGEEPAPAPKAKVAEPKAAPRPAEAGRLVFGIDGSARVLRTFVLKGPDRFVIDLVGQRGPVAIRGGKARVGNHGEFVRIVIDGDRAIERGQVDTKGGELSVRLHLAR